MSRPSIVITGLGSASALGAETDTLWSALRAGRSGLSAMDRFAVQAGQCRVAAQVGTPVHQALHPLQPEPRAMQLGLHAAAEATAQAALAGDPDRLGVAIGSGVGMADLVEDLCARSVARTPTSPVAAFRGFSHSLTCELVRRNDARGPVATVSSGCNSGLDAIGLAVDWIRLGKADRVLTGGAEAEITPSFWAAMSAARALSTRYNDRPAIASRPFDVDRGGNIAGEGAACLVLERENERDRAAQPTTRPIARVLGWAALGSGTRPAYDPFHPVADPTPMVRAMRAALRDADIAPSDIGGISANGSASVFYDPLECEAIRLLFGDDAPPVFSIKGGLGQTGAVTPALSVTAAALACRDGLLPPTVNCDRPDPACAVDIVRGAPRPIARGKAILCNAIGFGGQYYASMVIAAVA